MAATITTTRLTGEIGQSGTIVTQGFIAMQDWDREMIGLRALRTIDMMRNGDATIKAAYTAIILPIIQANWFITPASEDPLDLEIADQIEDNLFDGMTITFTDFIRQALLYLAYGFYVFEIVYDFDPVSKKIVWKKFAPRLPWTILKWELDNGQAGVTQQVPGGDDVQIPMEKLIVLVNEKEGDNWFGRSIFRPAFNSWKFKVGLEKIDAVSHERQGLGIPQMTYPAGATEEQKSKAEAILRNIRAHQQAHVLLTEGWTFAITDMKGGSTRNAADSLKYHVRQILMTMLAEFLELGSGGSGGRSGGSYALSQDQSSLFELTLKSYGKHLAEAMNRYVIPRLVQMNYSGIQKYPTLDFSKMGDVDMNIYSTALQRLVAAQVVHPDENMEDYARDLMNLPEVSEEDRAELELEKFLDEMEGKSPFAQDQINAPAPGTVAPGMAGDEVDKDTVTGKSIADVNAKIQVDPDPAPAPGTNDPDSFNQMQMLNAQLDAFVNQQRMALVKKRKNGAQFTPVQVQQMILDILAKKDEILNKKQTMQKVIPYKGEESGHDILLTMSERVNHAIEQLEQLEH